MPRPICESPSRKDDTVAGKGRGIAQAVPSEWRFRDRTPDPSGERRPTPDSFLQSPNVEIYYGAMRCSDSRGSDGHSPTVAIGGASAEALISRQNSSERAVDVGFLRGAHDSAPTVLHLLRSVVGQGRA